MTYSKLVRVSMAAIILAAPVSLPQLAVADQVINDDLIVDGSTCIGTDCVNGESFSFDTLRLKENNTRINFTDTSSTASFPRTDWTLVANSSANGGGSYFAIQDDDRDRMPFLVEANAPQNALRIDDGGRLGLGTATPTTEIHSVDGDTPTLRLEQNGSSGFAPQIWDLAGNEINFFIRDASNGSRLPFRIQPGADTNALFVNDDSRIGMGSANPDASLHIRDFGSNVGIRIEHAAVAEWDILVGETDGEFDIDDISTTGADFRFKTADALENNPWEFVHRVDNGLGINIATTPGGEFILSDTGDLRVTGTITSGGPTCAAGCDAVFDADYALPTMEEQAESMFAARHLPTVGPTSPDQPINLTEHMGNVLNELEKAHIFIAQLNERNKALEVELVESKQALQAELIASNAALEARLEQLEASMK